MPCHTVSYYLTSYLIALLGIYVTLVLNRHCVDSVRDRSINRHPTSAGGRQPLMYIVCADSDYHIELGKMPPIQPGL